MTVSCGACLLCQQWVTTSSPRSPMSTDDLSQTTMGQILCGLCAICGMMIITVPIPMLVSSFAITYKSKLWRTKISTKRRLMQGKVPKKTNILLNLASSSGMSGVLT